MIKPAAKCDPNHETQTDGKETNHKAGATGRITNDAILPHRGPSPKGSFRIGSSELTTKQSDSYLEVSGEAKAADAIMEEEDRGEEDGQGEKEEEEENEEKSQSQVARDSSTVNS